MRATQQGAYAYLLKPVDVGRLKSVLVMCYYELPEVQREIGYDPAPYIAAVSRRRLDSYGPDIRAGEAAVTGELPWQPWALGGAVAVDGLVVMKMQT